MEVVDDPDQLVDQVFCAGKMKPFRTKPISSLVTADIVFNLISLVYNVLG